MEWIDSLTAPRETYSEIVGQPRIVGSKCQPECRLIACRSVTDRIAVEKPGQRRLAESRRVSVKIQTLHRNGRSYTRTPCTIVMSWATLVVVRYRYSTTPSAVNAESPGCGGPRGPEACAVPVRPHFLLAKLLKQKQPTTPSLGQGADDGITLRAQRSTFGWLSSQSLRFLPSLSARVWSGSTQTQRPAIPDAMYSPPALGLRGSQTTLQWISTSCSSRPHIVWSC